MITKKDFKAIAEIINSENNKNKSFGIGEDFINKLCDYFKSQNPLFDEYKFKEVCLK